MSVDNTKIQELLLDFYSNQENTKLANYYATPTLFDMIKKSRSETVHSAVIKWLLEGNDFPNQGSNSTLMHFLQTVLRRKTGIGFGDNAKQNDAKFDESLKNAIYSDTLKLSNIEIATEKSVGDFGVDTDDRLDIYIKCDTNIPFDNPKEGKKYRVLEIFIENKVCSNENLPKNTKDAEKKSIILVDLKNEAERYTKITKSVDQYDDLYQTDRYYYACKNEEHIQLFVFLSALNKSELDSFNKLAIGKERCWCENFVQICYQDLLDYVIEPQLSVENMPDRAKNWLDEYVKCLSVPAAETDEDGNVAESSDQVIMAVTASEREKLEAFFKSEKNKQLLDIVFSQYSIKDYYNVDGKTNLTFEEALKKAFKEYQMPSQTSEDGTLRCKKDKKTNANIIQITKKEKKSDFLRSNINEIKDNSKKNYVEIRGDLYANTTFINAIDKINSLLNGSKKIVLIEKNTLIKDIILNPFWEKYQPLILSALNIYSQGANVNPYYKDLYSQFTKADNTKFIIGDGEVAVGKRRVVAAFIECLWQNGVIAKNNLEETNKWFNERNIKVGSSKIILNSDDYSQLKDSDKGQDKNKKVKSKRYKEEQILTDRYWVSTEWGGKISSTRKIDNFPKVWKAIEDYNINQQEVDKKFIVKVVSV